MEKNLKLSSPWVNYYREIEPIFKEDPAIKVKFDESSTTIKIYVEGSEKAEALMQLLPMEKQFGNITVKIAVIPANDLKTLTKVEMFCKAFEGNAAVSFIGNGSDPISNHFTYIVFKPTVVQYFADDLSSINGLRSTLYQEIAKDIFEQHEGIYFCTDRQ